MVIRHESLPSHYPRVPSVVISNSTNNGAGGMVHASYSHPSSRHGHHPDHSQAHHLHTQQQHHYHPHQQHVQRYSYANHLHHYSHHHPVSGPHHPRHSPSNQSPSHHAAAALQSMQQQQLSYSYHYHPAGPPPKHGPFVPPQQLQHGHNRHMYPMATSSPSSKHAARNVTRTNSAEENSSAQPSNTPCGFNMLIAAATSESMNSIDESDPSSESKGPNKGILKKNPRGKQVVSSCENVDESQKKQKEHEQARASYETEDRRSPSSSPAELCDEVRIAKNEDQSELAKLDETILSAGPLKKRRKIDELSIDDEDETQKKSETASLFFLDRLHALLTNDAEDKTCDEDVSKAMEWLPQGKGFRVLRWDVLSEKVLPRYFSEWESRKANEKHDCNEWIHMFRGYLKECGFQEVKFGKEFGSFRHESFIRDDPKLVRKITFQHERTDLSPTCDYNDDIGRSGSSLDGGMEWRSARSVAHSIFKLPRTGVVQSNADHEERTPGLASLGESQSHPSYLHMPVLTTTATASFSETWGITDERNNRENHHNPTRLNSHPPSNTHFPRPYPPYNSIRRESKEGEVAVGRSPKIIRFREDLPGDDEGPHSQSRISHHLSSRSSSMPAIEISPYETSNSPCKAESRLNETKHINDNKQTLHYDVVQITPNPEYDHATTSLKHVHFPVSRRGGRGMSRGGAVVRPVPISRHGRNASH
ncbi:hypothetical protein HJC23_012727 [Cyclotella cryptica]|uniref:HSF-type DNA-binding domain-containing protein n=1 Tax=Cyclotella cryptica TaxID=29204 RepID=A0ABD3NTR3_9STRA